MRSIPPLSLDGRGIKGEGDCKKAPPLCHSEQSEESTRPGTPHRHTGFKAVSTAHGKQQDNTTDRIPSPLMGEESKVRVKTMQSIVRIPSPSYWLQGSIHRVGQGMAPVIADLIRNPEGRRVARATTRQHNQPNPPLP